MSANWTFEGYWNVVLGTGRNPSDVVREFDLDITDRAGLDEWLGSAEAEAWAMGGNDHPVPVEWVEYHERALSLLAGTCQAWLCDYDDASRIRPATEEEARESRDAAQSDGGAGVIRVDGRRCYVEE